MSRGWLSLMVSSENTMQMLKKISCRLACSSMVKLVSEAKGLPMSYFAILLVNQYQEPS